jgi:hypothetical protein
MDDTRGRRRLRWPAVIAGLPATGACDGLVPGESLSLHGSTGIWVSVALICASVALGNGYAPRTGNK